MKVFQSLPAYFNGLEGFNVDWMRIFLLTQVPCRLKAHVLSWGIWAQFLIGELSRISSAGLWVKPMPSPPTPWLCIPSLLFWGRESSKVLDSTLKKWRRKIYLVQKAFWFHFPSFSARSRSSRSTYSGDSSGAPLHMPMEDISAEMAASDVKTHPSSRPPWVTLARGDPAGDSCPALEELTHTSSFGAVATPCALGRWWGQETGHSSLTNHSMHDHDLGWFGGLDVSMVCSCLRIVLCVPRASMIFPLPFLLLQLKASRWRQDIKHFVHSSMNWRVFMFNSF